MNENQRGWRNLSPDAFKLALGRRYNRTKKQGARTDLTSDQIDTKLQPQSTAAKLAKEHSVSEATVKRAGKFAEEVAKKPGKRQGKTHLLDLLEKYVRVCP